MTTATVIAELRSALVKVEQEITRLQDLAGHLGVALGYYEGQPGSSEIAKAEVREDHGSEKEHALSVPVAAPGAPAEKPAWSRHPRGALRLTAAVAQVLQQAAPLALTTRQIWDAAQLLGVVSEAKRPVSNVFNVLQLGHVPDAERAPGGGWRWGGPPLAAASGSGPSNEDEKQEAVVKESVNYSVNIPAPFLSPDAAALPEPDSTPTEVYFPAVHVHSWRAGPPVEGVVRATCACGLAKEIDYGKSVAGVI